MTPKAALAGVLLTAMVAVWWWTLAQPGALPGTVPVRPAVTPRSAASADAPPTVALERLRGAAFTRAPLHGGRDPFAGVAGGNATVVTSPGLSTPMVVADASVPTGPSWPRLELIGIAEQVADGTTARVAILATARGVHHARAGELVEQVYRVERVGADAVDVRLVPEDRLIRFALR